MGSGSDFGERFWSPGAIFGIQKLVWDPGAGLRSGEALREAGAVPVLAEFEFSRLDVAVDLEEGAAPDWDFSMDELPLMALCCWLAAAVTLPTLFQPGEEENPALP